MDSRTLASTLVGLFIGIAAAPACGESAESCDAGSEGCPCAAEGQCLPGLSCVSEVCVDLEGETTGVFTTADPTSAGSSASAGDDDGDDGGTDGGSNDDAGSADDDGGSDDGVTGGSEPGGPEIINLTTNVNSIGPGEILTVSVIVTDPDGIDDVIGGQLLTTDGSAVFGTFGTQAQEGAYSVSVTYEEVLNVHGSDLAHPTEVVAQQVDDHHVLRLVLVRARQLVPQPCVLGRRPAPATGPLHRAGDELAVPIPTNEQLRRGRQHRPLVCFEEGSVAT